MFVCVLQVIVGPEKMIVVPPRHYCLVENPAVKDKDGKPVFDTHGQVRIALVGGGVATRTRNSLPLFFLR